MVHHVNHPQAPAIINLVNSVQHSFGGSHFPEISRGLHYQLHKLVQTDCGSEKESKQDLRCIAEEPSVL